MIKTVNAVMISLLALLSLGGFSTASLAQESDCLDKKDNDGDGYVDCADRDCQLSSQSCERREDWIEKAEGTVVHVYPDTISVRAAIGRGDTEIFLSKTDVDGTYTHSSTRLYQNLTQKGSIEATHYLVNNGRYYNYAWKIIDKSTGKILETFQIETPIGVGEKCSLPSLDKEAFTSQNQD